jgi:hypothetical protein
MKMHKDNSTPEWVGKYRVYISRQPEEFMEFDNCFVSFVGSDSLAVYSYTESQGRWGVLIAAFPRWSFVEKV